MNDDAQWLLRYAETGSEEAFRVFVDRHLPLVYSTALRVVNADTHLAEDVAQRVFSDVARKARSLANHPVPAGWLHRHTTFTASKIVRSERRRRTREQEALRMKAEFEPEPTDDHWDQMALHLDQALDSLSRPDREAVVLRFLERRDLRSVGSALGCSDDAAQKRVTRAVGKLRLFLERRGVTLSTAALSTVLGSHAVGAAPAGLSAAITSSAIASATAATTVGAGMVSTFVSLMSTENLTTIIVSGLLVAGLGTPLVLQYKANRALEEENHALRQQAELVDQLRAENEILAAVHINSEEADRLRRENTELHRLRGEVAQLRREREDATRLAAENIELRRKLGEMAGDFATEDHPTPSALPGDLSGAAWKMQAAFVRENAVQAGEPEAQIPSIYWSDPIKALNPIKVYIHRVNIVVVQHIADRVETGQYIYIPISSYLPANGEDGFTFTPAGQSVYDYRRIQPDGAANN